MNFREAFNLRHTACVISSGAGEVERNDNLTKISLWLILHKHGWGTQRPPSHVCGEFYIIFSDHVVLCILCYVF